MREVYIGKSVLDENGKEIRINYEQIDVDESSNISYEYTSPIFEDLGSIKCSRTNTYKVPATAHNLRIFGLANEPDVDTDIPHINMYFQEYRDGLPIISNGQCRILEATDKEISLAVAWGNKVNIQKLSDIKLNQLNFKEWVRNTNEDSAPTEYLLADNNIKYGFLYINFGKGFNTKYVDPCVRADFVLDKLAENLGLEFDCKLLESSPNDDKLKITQCWMPLTSEGEKPTVQNPTCILEAKLKEVIHEITDNEPVENIIPTISMLEWNVVKGSDPYQLWIKSTPMENSSTLTGGKKNIKVAIAGKIRVLPNRDEDNNSPKMSFTIKASGSTLEQTKSVGFMYDTPTESWIATINIEMSLDTNAQETVTLSTSIPEGLSITEPLTTIFTLDDDTVDYMSLAPLMPDMTGADYLKSIMQMFGLFAFYDRDKTNVVRLASMDDIYEKIKNGEAKDWSNKRLQDDRNIVHTFRNYAKKNNAKYAKDETVSANTVNAANGTVNVDASFLEDEKELFTLKFAPSDMSNGVAVINHYYDEEKKDEENQPDTKTNKITPRILKEDELSYTPNDLKKGIFDKSMFFSGNNGILTTHYNTYQKVIKRPVVLQVSVYLSAMDLHNLSEIDVIYLDGNYYMPISIQCDSKGNTKCKLLLLPEAHT